MLAPVAEFIPALSRLKLSPSLNIRPGGTTEVPLRHGAGDNEELAAQWSQTADGYLKEVWLKLKRVGAIAGGSVVKLRIESDTAGLPSATVLGTSQSIAADGISSERFTWVKFTFAVHVQLTKSTIYHAVLEGDYTPSSANHVVWQSATVASGGNQEVKDGSWADVATENFAIYAQEYDLSALRFAEPAIYTPGGGSAKEIPVIFDSQYVGSEIVGLEYQNDAPSAVCRTEDVSDANDAASIKIRGVTYKVTIVQPDSDGMTRFVLSLDSPQ